MIKSLYNIFVSVRGLIILNISSLNDTVSGGEPEYDRHSESLEPDVSIEVNPLVSNFYAKLLFDCY